MSSDLPISIVIVSAVALLGVLFLGTVTPVRPLWSNLLLGILTVAIAWSIVDALAHGASTC
jgi:hypothetical protein